MPFLPPPSSPHRVLQESGRSAAGHDRCIGKHERPAKRIRCSAGPPHAILSPSPSPTALYDRTVAELHLDMAYASGNATELQSQFDALLGRLMASGHLPNNATFSWVSQCLSSRLEPSLFPYRPQVCVKWKRVEVRALRHAMCDMRGRGGAEGHSSHCSYRNQPPPPPLPLVNL